ncbi:MAG: hypothetical protein H6Q84_1393 [Deltaproteobacteria bacterium]|nr:hypothetical protein [Deltaproteobacteria bacterium]
MTLACRKTSVRESAAQWNLDALVETPGGDLLPCFVSVISTYCTVQSANTGEGEEILSAVGKALGMPPSTPPQVVKGGSCDGGDGDEEFPFSGSMVSATWDFPAGRKAEVLSAFRDLFGLGPGEAR